MVISPFSDVQKNGLHFEMYYEDDLVGKITTERDEQAFYWQSWPNIPSDELLSSIHTNERGSTNGHLNNIAHLIMSTEGVWQLQLQVFNGGHIPFSMTDHQPLTPQNAIPPHPQHNPLRVPSHVHISSRTLPAITPGLYKYVNRARPLPKTRGHKASTQTRQIRCLLKSLILAITSDSLILSAYFHVWLLRATNCPRSLVRYL